MYYAQGYGPVPEAYAPPPSVRRAPDGRFMPLIATEEERRARMIQRNRYRRWCVRQLFLMLEMWGGWGEEDLQPEEGGS